MTVKASNAKKKFRIAREGATTDGRKISREWIEQMARNYDPKKYGARINLEHIRGIFPDGPFRAYGDVTALSTEEADGVLYLVAELDPTDDLLELSQNRQKIYTSIEVDPDFSDTGEAYLVGLAVTDSPSSLGTEMLKFSAAATTNPLAARKTSPHNLFSAAELELDFSGMEPEPEQPGLLETVKNLFTKYRQNASASNESFRADLEQSLECFVAKITELESQVAGMKAGEAFSDLQTAHNDLKAKFTALVEKLDKTPDVQTHRSTATGGGEMVQTDC